MPRSIWDDFKYANSSSIDISKPNMKDSNVHLDLLRARDELWINGVKLREIASAYNDFAGNGDARSFFDQRLLHHFIGTKVQRVAAVNYLMKTFHQGGLLYPVSTPIATSCIDKAGNCVAMPHSNAIRKQVYIQTTKTGFIIQEFCTIDAMMANPDGVLYDIYPDNIITPPDEKPSLIQAQGKLNIDFMRSGAEPSLTVESNLIEFFHPEIEKLMDHRSLVQMIVDFFQKLFNCNKVPESICGEIKSSSDEVKENAPLASSDRNLAAQPDNQTSTAASREAQEISDVPPSSVIKP